MNKGSQDNIEPKELKGPSRAWQGVDKNIFLRYPTCISLSIHYLFCILGMYILLKCPWYCVNWRPTVDPILESVHTYQNKII